MTDTMIGVDLAKNVFQLHGASMTGHVKFRRKVTRPQFRQFMAGQPPAVVVLEAYGSASYWARELVKLGHDVRLIAPQYVRPFVKRQKNDAADAEGAFQSIGHGGPALAESWRAALQHETSIRLPERLGGRL